MKDLGDAICPDGIQKPLHALITQQLQAPSNPRVQEGHISQMEQGHSHPVEIPSMSPIFMR